MFPTPVRDRFEPQSALSPLLGSRRKPLRASARFAKGMRIIDKLGIDSYLSISDSLLLIGATHHARQNSFGFLLLALVLLTTDKNKRTMPEKWRSKNLIP